ncbi:MAG: ATP-binding cassette domain-containing protein, partial [Pseudomonadota bacterium]
MTTLLQLRHVCTQVGPDTTLRFPDMDLAIGDRLVLEGPSGSGKTTLLRTLARLERLSGGELNGTALRIGYAFQEPRLIPQLPVVDNLCIVSRTPRASLHDAHALLARVGLSHLAQQIGSTLSGGEAQRINVLRAVMAQPDLLLLDEIGSAQDSDAWCATRAVVTEFSNTHP